jgi:phenylpropionate dioxygenase-like ring-hydroxylating dioxygenase large terminal subunit
MKIGIVSYVLVSVHLFMVEIEIEAWNPFSLFRLFTPSLNLSEKPSIKSYEKTLETRENRKAWYIIGKSNEFEVNKLYPIVLQEKKYVVWKDGTEDSFGFYALENQCSHKGASLSSGFIDQGCLVCPFHFSYFSKDGSLILGNTILKEGSARKNTSISSYSVVSQDNWIYLNPNPDSDLDLDLKKESFPIYNTSTSKEKTEIETDYACSAEIIAEKMLDIIHYYQDPNPGPNDLLILQQPRWISSKRTNASQAHGQDTGQSHAQTIYQFRSGIRPITENIFTQRAGRTYFTVESEFVLPYTFITKIQTGDYSLKIISCISPISSQKCRVYTKIHRNFGKNWLGETMVRNFVHTFLEHNREILEKIDYTVWKQRGVKRSRYYYRQEKMIRFYRQAFDSLFGIE